MIIEFLTGAIKAVKAILGIKATVATTSVVTTGGVFVVYGGLLMWIFIISILIKAGLTAFKGSSVEKMDPVEDAKRLIKRQQKKQPQQQQAEQKRTVVIDRVINK